jgi:DNA-binding CsgD family transcriptional regulator
MSRHSPFAVELSVEERTLLEQLSRARSAPHASVVRAKIVLLSAERCSNTVIAARLGVHVNTVRTWRKRFFEFGLRGLIDRPWREQSWSSSAGVAAKVETPERHRAVKQARPVPPSPTVANTLATDAHPRASAPGPIRGANQAYGQQAHRSRRPNSPMPTAIGQLLPFRSPPEDTSDDILRHLVTVINDYLDETDVALAQAGQAGGPWRSDRVDHESAAVVANRVAPAVAQKVRSPKWSPCHARAADRLLTPPGRRIPPGSPPETRVCVDEQRSES